MANYCGDEIFDRRPYDDFCYLILTKEVNRVVLGLDNASIRAFVYEKDDLFGDPMPLNLAGLDIEFNIYNSDNILVSTGDAVVSDLDTSEIEYQIQNLDIREIGKYFGQFVFIDLDGRTFSLPSPKQKQRILINVV